MTKPAAIREADIARAARVAKRKNVSIEIAAGGQVIRIEIAEATGHNEREAERIIRAHYLAGDAVIRKMERKG